MCVIKTFHCAKTVTAMICLYAHFFGVYLTFVKVCQHLVKFRVPSVKVLSPSRGKLRRTKLENWNKSLSSAELLLVQHGSGINADFENLIWEDLPSLKEIYLSRVKHTLVNFTYIQILINWRAEIFCLVHSQQCPGLPLLYRGVVITECVPKNTLNIDE